MKNKEKKGRLVALLAKGFLGFTAAVITVTFLALWMSNAYYAYLSSVPDIDALCSDKNLLAGNYEKVPVGKYLGEKGGFGVVAEDGTLIFRSVEALDVHYTEGELSCIQSYDQYSYVDYTSFQSHTGKREHLFIRYIYDEDYNAEEQVMILDENYNVVGGSFEEGKSFYTPDEVKLLTGEAFPGLDLLQCRLDSERILITLSETQDYAYYAHLSERANRIFLVVIPLYGLVLAGFLMWISRKIKTPLVQLNQVIEARAAGNNAKAGDLKGPWEIRQIGRTFDRMTDRLEHSEKQRRHMDEERQRIITAVSHDLKTPITVISGYTKAVRDGMVPPEQLKVYLERIDSKASELTEMINSLHEFSKVEHPDFSLQTERTDVCEFLRSYLAERYQDIEFHGFHLDAMIPDDCQFCSMIDQVQMRRALDNLLYNTLRHNRLGTVLAVGISKVEGGNGAAPWLRIVFADNGNGIPAELRDKIFDPFIMGDESRRGKGSGLGLSITKNIIHSHGGEIRLCQSKSQLYSTEFEILLRMIV